MRRDLTAAMKARDKRAVATLRSTLAAIDNAEAVDAAAGRGHPAGAGEGSIAGAAGAGAAGADAASAEAASAEVVIAGAALGVGAAEVERRVLTAAEMEAIVRREVAERERAAEDYERAGQAPHADRLRAEAELLNAYLDAGAEPV
jgi:uncharacterized protein YqeY